MKSRSASSSRSAEFCATRPMSEAQGRPASSLTECGNGYRNKHFSSRLPHELPESTGRKLSSTGIPRCGCSGFSQAGPVSRISGFTAFISALQRLDPRGNRLEAKRNHCGSGLWAWFRCAAPGRACRTGRMRNWCGFEQDVSRFRALNEPKFCGGQILRQSHPQRIGDQIRPLRVCYLLRMSPKTISLRFINRGHKRYANTHPTGWVAGR
jgi:hypothetical protein